MLARKAHKIGVATSTIIIIARPSTAYDQNTGKYASEWT
jgi:hypothetical protein